MTQRREFLKGSLAAVSVMAFSSATVSHASQDPYTNIVFTSSNPGKWDKKVGSHLPSITIDGNKVTLFTKHGMAAKHYIVRHTLVLGNGTIVGAKAFASTDKEAKSSYELPAGYKGKILATSFCNLHDLWVNEAEV